MKTSATIATLATALCKAQAQVKDAIKRGTNPHFKSKYAPIEEVISACKEALNSNGISFIQGAEPTEGDTLQLSTMLLHTSGEWIESTLTMRPVKNDPQGIGSCITYARRYSLAAICGVASDEDDDGNAASTPQKHWSELPSGQEVLKEFADWLVPITAERDKKLASYNKVRIAENIQQAHDIIVAEKKRLETA